MGEHLELLQEAVDEMESLIGMMEPYYSQCDADREARELIQRIRAALPAPPAPYVAPPICCQHCEGAKARRVFKTKQALNNHVSSVHFDLMRSAISEPSDDKPCPECGIYECNGQCFGDDMMGGD
jgi:hypothetical protein